VSADGIVQASVTDKLVTAIIGDVELFTKMKTCNMIRASCGLCPESRFLRDWWGKVKYLNNEVSRPAGIDWEKYKESIRYGLKVFEVTAFCPVTLHIECAAECSDQP
jgi:hypothetical protein